MHGRQQNDLPALAINSSVCVYVCARVSGEGGEACICQEKRYLLNTAKLYLGSRQSLKDTLQGTKKQSLQGLSPLVKVKVSPGAREGNAGSTCPSRSQSLAH